MKLLLIRHGETSENHSGIIIGQNPGQLTTYGLKQAKQLRDKLTKTTIDLVYVSDLKRCLDTAKILFEKRSMQIMPEPRFREIHFGDFQGKPYSAIKENYLDNLNKKFPNGESNTEFIKRVVDAINDIQKRETNKTVAIVCHSGTISVLNAAVRKRKYVNELQNKAEHSEVYELEMNDYLEYPF